MTIKKFLEYGYELQVTYYYDHVLVDFHPRLAQIETTIEGLEEALKVRFAEIEEALKARLAEIERET